MKKWYFLSIIPILGCVVSALIASLAMRNEARHTAEMLFKQKRDETKLILKMANTAYNLSYDNIAKTQMYQTIKLLVEEMDREDNVMAIIIDKNGKPLTNRNYKDKGTDSYNLMVKDGVIIPRMKMEELHYDIFPWREYNLYLYTALFPKTNPQCKFILCVHDRDLLDERSNRLYQMFVSVNLFTIIVFAIIGFSLVARLQRIVRKS